MTTAQPSLPTIFCSGCQVENVGLARFCRSCGVPLEADFDAGWTETLEAGELNWALSNQRLLAIGLPQRVEIRSLQSGQPVAQLDKAADSGLLLDTLLLLWRADSLESVHLSPRLLGEVCPIDSSRRLSLPGEIRGRPAWSDPLLAFQAGRRIVCLERKGADWNWRWQQPALKDTIDLVWSLEGLWVLQADRLRLLEGAQGRAVLDLPLPEEGLFLHRCEQGTRLLTATGAVWQVRGEQLRLLGRGSALPTYSWSVQGSRALLCHGRKLTALQLDRGRSLTLTLPQPCVTAPVWGADWFLLSGYDGLLMRYQWQGNEPQLRWTSRPFPSHEPTIRPMLPVPGGAVLVGPEGQLQYMKLPA